MSRFLRVICVLKLRFVRAESDKLAMNNGAIKLSGLPPQFEIELSHQDIDDIYVLAEKKTGTYQEGRYRKGIIVSNVKRRMKATGFRQLGEYILFTQQDKNEHDYLISALTIHTTSWFRENPQYEILEKRVSDHIKNYRTEPFTMLCAGCSSGEEVYSFALVLEKLRYFYHGFDYFIIGMDIDPISIRKGQSSIYDCNRGLSDIPPEYHKFLLKGSGKTEGYFTLSRGVRDRCTFITGDMTNLIFGPGETYDVVVCRNALIYFHNKQAKRIAQNLLSQVRPNGLLILGTSEALVGKSLKLENLGQACYVCPQEKINTVTEVKSRILVVEDAPVDRAIIKRKFEKRELEVFTVDSAEDATKILEKEKFDLITLDLHLPGQSGQSWLMEQREKGLKTPVVIISAAVTTEALKVIDALKNGAQDYFNKDDLRQNSAEVIERVEAIILEYKKSGDRLPEDGVKPRRASRYKRPDVILIGASTGGTEVLFDVLKSWPIDSPPVLVVQHIAHQFARAFYERLGQASGLKAVEPVDKMVLQRNHLYMSTGDYHIGIAQEGDQYILRFGSAMTYGVHRPSVDHLFKSACRIKGNVTAAILTGMGKDGARGLLELHRKGAFTYAQNEASCTVFGMPKEAIELGAARAIGNPDFIRRGIIASLTSAVK